jgi:hypothetical protein
MYLHPYDTIRHNTTRHDKRNYASISNQGDE